MKIYKNISLLILLALHSGVFGQIPDSSHPESLTVLLHHSLKVNLVQPKDLKENKLSLNSVLKEANPIENKIDYRTLFVSGFSFSAIGTYLHNQQSKAWWIVSDRFHFENGLNNGINLGNISHFYGVNLLGHLFSGGYEASGMQALESTWFSSLTALSYEFYVEFEDAHHQGHGFSIKDAGMDLLGAGFYIGQYYYPFLKNFQPKISYWPTGDQKKNNHLIIDDHFGQKYWMGIRIKEFIPQKVRNYWPSFVNFALGIGPGKDLSLSNSNLYMALDLDAEELPLYGPFWQFVKNTLNYIHFPMPGIRINNKTAVFLLCF